MRAFLMVLAVAAYGQPEMLLGEAGMPAERQMLFFSATMPRAIQDLIGRYSRDPEWIRIEAVAQNAPTKAQQQEAATRFKKGLDLFKDGDYQASLIEFRRANELAPNYNVLYNIGGNNERANLEVVRLTCAILDELRPRDDGGSYAKQITFVRDRPGHDRRYAIDARKVMQELGWAPVESFESGMRKTVEWYLANPSWVEGVTSGAYREWLTLQYQG